MIRLESSLQSWKTSFVKMELFFMAIGPTFILSKLSLTHLSRLLLMFLLLMLSTFAFGLIIQVAALNTSI